MFQAGLSRQGRGSSTGLLVLAALSASLLAGCAKRDSITVGAIPDDYRTNHPIVISEREEVMDVPVGASALRMSRGQRDVVAGFLAGYDPETGAPMRILVPANTVNAPAALMISHEIEGLARARGVHPGNILVQSYQASSPEASAPIRVGYYAMRASTGPCGRWPEDMLKTHDNKHWANFGCSYQNNLAAQIANPADLIGPRKPTEIDPENRAAAIEQYKARGITPDFNRNSEITY
jgi:pilus assembly protein CpaD